MVCGIHLRPWTSVLEDFIYFLCMYEKSIIARKISSICSSLPLRDWGGGKFMEGSDWLKKPTAGSLLSYWSILVTGFSGGSAGEESTCNAGDTGWIPGSGRSPGGENGNPLQYSCLENPMDRGTWRAAVHEVAELNMTEVT